MTDPELIARMRSVLTFKDLRLCPTAADRIEQLVVTNEALTAKLASSEATLLENEVRLRKAVEIGNKMAHSIEGNYYLPNIAGEWRKVAAEISSEAALNKGESHE